MEKLGASGRRLVSVPSIVHGAPETAEVSLLLHLHVQMTAAALTFAFELHLPVHKAAGKILVPAADKQWECSPNGLQ